MRLERKEKARRLVEEGLVYLVYSDGDTYVFKVIGDTEPHTVIYRDNRWMCDCKWSALHPDDPCSHILACKYFLFDKIKGGGRTASLPEKD